MNVQIDVPVTLMKDDETYWLRVKDSLGREAMLNLEAGRAITDDILHTWADEQMKVGLLKRRRKTGLKDDGGRDVYEADIVESYAGTRSVVKWHQPYAAFVLYSKEGELTPNLNPVQERVVIGNAFENPELL